MHKNHILDSSVFPFNLPEALLKQGKEIVLDLAEQLKLVGILCVEFFLTKEGELLINEIAPRTHNSGHLTIEAFNISQFELHLRAITGMPLGNGLFFKPACMVNLLGDVWGKKEPKWQELSKYPDVKLHLYGKKEAKKGRKMGHLTCLADSVEEAYSRAISAREAISY